MQSYTDGGLILVGFFTILSQVSIFCLKIRPIFKTSYAITAAEMANLQRTGGNGRLMFNVKSFAVTIIHHQLVQLSSVRLRKER